MAVFSTERKYGIEASLVRDLLLSSANRYADRVALRQKMDGDYTDVTYRCLRSDVEALGTALMGKGERRMLIVGENCYEWALSYLACLAGAGLAVPVDMDFSPEELLKLAAFAEVTTVLYSDAVAEKLVALPDGVEKYAFSEFPELLEKGRERLDAGEDSVFERALDKNTPCALFFTSASTDMPKGVLLSNENLCYTLRETAKLVDITEEDRFLSVLPLHHIFESTCTLLGSIAVGASVAFGEGLRSIIKNMNEVEPTVLVCVPMIAEALAKWIAADARTRIERAKGAVVTATDFLPQKGVTMAAKRKLFAALHKKLGGNLRMVITGGSPVSPEVLKTIRSVGIATVEGYGLTECAPVVSLNPADAFRGGSVGLPLASSTVDIYNVQEDGRGEIRYKGGNCMLGYFKNPELTSEVKRGDWLYTGDLGYLDKDGYLYIVGRKKNAIVMASGKHVYPEELERSLCQSAFVKEAIVVAFMNEQRQDNDLVAVIYPDYATFRTLYGDIYSRADVETELALVIEKVNGALPAYKQIACFLIRETEFEKHRSRKLRRTGVAESVLEEYKQTIE